MERLSKWKAIIQTPSIPLPYSISPCLSLLPAIVLYHFRLFIIFTFCFHLFSFFSPSPLPPRNVLLPSASQPFIPSSLTFSLIISSLWLLSPPHLSRPLSFHLLFCSLSSHSSPLSSQGPPLNWTDHKGPLGKRNVDKHSILRLATAANW